MLSPPPVPRGPPAGRNLAGQQGKGPGAGQGPDGEGRRAETTGQASCGPRRPAEGRAGEAAVSAVVRRGPPGVV